MPRKARYGPYNYERTLGTRDYNFVAQVDEFARENEKRLRDIALNSIVDVINEAQRTREEGGKMRVDIGFLRASGTLSIDAPPSGEDTPEKGKRYTTKPVSILELANVRIGQTVYFGWVAHYAKYREAYDGFLISAVQNFQAIVDKRIQQRRDRIEKTRK